MLYFVTGTGTDVGKTVVTAALACCLRGRRAVVKLAQTGVAPGEPGDLAEVSRLSGVTDVHEFARYPEPLSPHHASRRAGAPEYDVAAAVHGIRALVAERDDVVVEGAGGLLVPYDGASHTMLDIAEQLDDPVFVLATLPGLGTLNHTALTVDRLAAHGFRPEIVLGTWPAEPGLAERLNVADLSSMAPGGRLAGAIPAGAPALPDFAARAHEWLGPTLGGSFDAEAFVCEAAR